MGWPWPGLGLDLLSQFSIPNNRHEIVFDDINLANCGEVTKSVERLPVATALRISRNSIVGTEYLKN